MVEDVRSISAMYHSTRPCDASRVSSRLLMVAVAGTAALDQSGGPYSLVLPMPHILTP